MGIVPVTEEENVEYSWFISSSHSTTSRYDTTHIISHTFRFRSDTVNR